MTTYNARSVIEGLARKKSKFTGANVAATCLLAIQLATRKQDTEPM